MRCETKSEVEINIIGFAGKLVTLHISELTEQALLALAGHYVS